MSRLPRPHFCIYLSISIFPPFSLSLPLYSFLSLFSLIFHSLLARHRFRAVHRDDWHIDSRVVQSGLRHRVCVFQKCWRRLSRRSSSPRARFHPIPRSLPLSSNCQLLFVSKSMGRVLSRSSMREYAITKVGAREIERLSGPPIFVSSPHANRSRPL